MRVNIVLAFGISALLCSRKVYLVPNITVRQGSSPSGRHLPFHPPGNPFSAGLLWPPHPPKSHAGCSSAFPKPGCKPSSLCLCRHNLCISEHQGEVGLDNQRLLDPAPHAVTGTSAQRVASLIEVLQRGICRSLVSGINSTSKVGSGPAWGWEHLF